MSKYGKIVLFNITYSFDLKFYEKGNENIIVDVIKDISCYKKIIYS